MSTLKAARDLLLAASALTAALALTSPARAAVIQVNSNAEQSPRYEVQDAGMVRLVGTISGSVQGQRYILEATTATLLPRIVLDGLPILSAMGNFRDLDPVTVPVPAASVGLPLAVSIAVDLSLDIGETAEIGMRPDLLIARGDNPYLNWWSFLTFRGTLSTGADALVAEANAAAGTSDATPVPEPATLAVLGVGLLGLLAARRRPI